MRHRPVLVKESLEFLHVKPEGTYVDATVGGGGHTAAIAERLTTGKVIGFDCDSQALSQAQTELARYGERITLVQANFKNFSSLLREHDIASIDGVIFDLGVSSFQLDTADRGFSFRYEAPLDMRVDQMLSYTAADIVNQYSAQQLQKIFREYGEERWARQIAQAIVQTRENQALMSTIKLAQLIEKTVSMVSRNRTTIHPATRVFQALRIAVNDELEALRLGLSQAWAYLKIDGRLVVISFHSLEDRLVKQFLREKASTCICPPDFPVCQCNKIQELEAWGPILPSEAEIRSNARSRSAKLRAAVKLA